MLKEDIDATPLSIGPQYDPDCIVRNFRNEEDFAWISITLRGGELFTDTKYWASLDDNLEWKRPKEICDRPIFVDRGPSRFDALQGDLGDCWFVAAMGALTLNCRLFKHVVPNNQGFDHNYVGAFHFRIWQLGIWYDVVVDDRLPVYKGQKKLYSVHSSSGNIFWAALLEKAYAKVNGTHEISYKSLKSGFTFTSMQDLSGGIIEEVETSKLSRGNMDVKSYLNENFFNKTMMCCGCHYNIDKDVGLYRYHAYAITSIYTPPERDPDSGGVFLVRIMNPWGHTEWKRDWADDDWNHWKTIDQNIRRKLQFVVRDDGEFWMNENDFIKHFKKIRICHLEPGQYLQSRYTGKILKNWNAISFFGEWVFGISAGGYELPTRHKNPQFRFSLEGCENRSTKGKQCNVVIELTYRSKLARLITFSMTFYVYSLQNITNPPMPLDQEFLKRNNPIIKNPPRTANHQRTYHTSLKLNPGMYCVIPCAKKEIYQAKFLLRIFSDSKVEGWEHDSRISRSLPMEEESLYEPSVEIMTLFNDVSQGKTEVDWIGLKNILDVGLNKKGSNRGVIGTLYTYIHDVLKKYLSLRSSDNCGNGDVVFTKDECRKMIAMLDYDHSGKISFPEFSSLWKKISFWAKVYEEHRDEAEGCITVAQVRDALSAIGYDINKRTVQSLSYAYANEKGNIELSDFILCGVVLETGLAYFQEQNTESDITVELTLEEWVKKSLNI